MRLITAISKSRIERQQLCISSWTKYTKDIVACNTKEDIEHLQPLFPDVKFIECPEELTGKALYDRPDRVSIYALAKCGPGLLLNSDIKIEGVSTKDFYSIWSPVSKMLKLGIRSNFDGLGKPKTQEKYGIDAFLLTEDVIESIPNLGFTIGVSVWDYWLVWHFITERYKIKPIYGHMLHLVHTSSWNEQDTAIGMELMIKNYRIDLEQLTKAVQVFTARDKQLCLS